ncbi:MAG TPA: carboxypeptidase-like regulatory domain-containing protein [Blastocatellia bacterium]|nr:carboxypeptidase-like regulatory domain-containing protein [Blastocatellia bacterium]
MAGQNDDRTGAQKSDQRGASITGRVVNDSGQPMPNAPVYVSGLGRPPERRATSTDENGQFRVDNLPRQPYSVSAQVRGYVRDTYESTFYKPGDSVSLVLKKGGVITGTVTNSAGEPVIGVLVSAIPIRDLEGSPLRSPLAGAPRYTDDRGVYRLFALPKGIYLVTTGSKLSAFSRQAAFLDDIPTYYPSATRDSAGELLVNSGAEVTGIDIRYRGEHGYTISGSITGSAAKGSPRMNVDVILRRASSDLLEAQTFSQPKGNDQSFTLHGVPEGDYYLIARRRPFESDDGASSRPVSMKLKNHDATGIEVSLTPLGSAAGRIVLEPTIAKDKAGCEGNRPASPPGSIAEVIVSLRSDQKPPSYGLSESVPVAPDDKGEFLIQGLDPGQYRVETGMLDESWYVRTITMPGITRATTTVDAGTNGFPIKAGQRAGGLTVTLAEGAASLRGRVIPEKDGATLPERLRVHLIPAETELADNTLRFAETAVQGDGKFKFNNLAPGRYRLLTSRASVEEAGERAPRPIAWKSSSRASLRRDGEASNITLDLKPCQRITDYKLRYAPAKAQATNQ